MRRALVFAHYDPHGIVDPYVLFALSAYRQYFETIHFVSTAGLGPEQQRRAATLAERVIVRGNIGYDFLSWRAGFEAIPNPGIFDEIVFANDSCYGPCRDLAPFWDKVEALGADLWGATLNRQFRPHVQSFFMGFGRRLIRSGFIERFWNGVENIPDKMQLILTSEVGLSARVEEAGFRVGGVVEFPDSGEDRQERVIEDSHSLTDPERAARALDNIRGEAFPNPMQLYWLEAFRRGLPLLKIELLRDNPLHANLVKVHAALRAANHYDIPLIARHLERTARAGPFPPPPARSNAALRDAATHGPAERLQRAAEPGAMPDAKRDLASLTREQAADNLERHARAGRLTREENQGRESKALVSMIRALHPDLDDPGKCPPRVMPAWLARLLALLNEGVRLKTVNAHGLRFATALRMGRMDEGVRRAFLAACVENAAAAVAPACEGQPWWAPIAGATATAAACLRDDTPAPSHDDIPAARSRDQPDTRETGKDAARRVEMAVILAMTDDEPEPALTAEAETLWAEGRAAMRHALWALARTVTHAAGDDPLEAARSVARATIAARALWDAPDVEPRYEQLFDALIEAMHETRAS